MRLIDADKAKAELLRMAMLTGRKFIGFEISAEYCDIAEKRIASVGKDIPLFEAD